MNAQERIAMEKVVAAIENLPMGAVLSLGLTIISKVVVTAPEQHKDRLISLIHEQFDKMRNDKW